MISVNRYYTFIIYSTLVFGIIFETPLVIFTGNKVGLLSIQMVKDFRRYAILFIFVFAGLFSPPDVFSQFLVAIPMILLYEFGILLCQFFGRPDPQKEEESSEN
jgi:sec-independent protein translocase protein TatC